jgi:hypothetical protein
MKVVISIFCLPYEIDDLENTLNQLKKASYYIDKKIDWCLDVTMCLANDMIDWNKSSMPKKFFEDKLLKLVSTTDWCTKNIQTSTEIKGCVSQRRYSLEKHREADYFIWLDCDIIFDERTLFYMEQGMKSTNKDYLQTIITPEIVRVWDNTWDCIVNEQFLDKPLDYQKTNDPYKDSGIKGDITVVGINNKTSPQSRFKFAGGWFTCISGKLLNKLGVPDSFGHYGYEDTFIMVASEKLMQTSNEIITQFKIKNLVVCENYKYRGHNHYLNSLSVYDRREEFKKISYNNFQLELNKVQ